MHFTRKSMSEASKTIFKEQRELTKEDFGKSCINNRNNRVSCHLDSCGFCPAYQFCRSECNVGIRAFQSARRSVFIWNR